MTTTNMKDKGFKCWGCFNWRPVVVRDVDGRDKCPDCLPESRQPLVRIAE